MSSRDFQTTSSAWLDENDLERVICTADEEPENLKTLQRESQKTRAGSGKRLSDLLFFPSTSFLDFDRLLNRLHLLVQAVGYLSSPDHDACQSDSQYTTQAPYSDFQRRDEHAEKYQSHDQNSEA